MELDQIELHLAEDTICKLMRELNVQVSLYNRHRNGKYSSYHGTVGKITDNRLKQRFNEKRPYHVIRYSRVRMPFNLSNKQTGQENVKIFFWRVVINLVFLF